MDKKKNHPPADQTLSVSRRNFLKLAGTVVAASSIGTVASCAASDVANAPKVVNFPNPEQPYVPPEPPPLGQLQFFTVHEAKTVEAFTARIMPGSPDDPGAREAGVTTYIDNMLTYEEGYAQPTYRQAPYAETYTADAPPVISDAPGAYQVVYVLADQLDRYGFQSIMSQRETYRLGLTALDQYAQSKFQAAFIDLTEEQQDQIVGDLANNKAGVFSQPTGIGFFRMVRGHTIEGMFSDPGYGGNRDMVGWKLIGYPGAQRAYTVDDIHNEQLALTRHPQNMAMLHEAHPGQPANANVILPQSGSGTLVPPAIPNNSNMQH